MKTPDAPDNNVGKINGKTPEEIKADAVTCLTRPQKSECNRFALYKECAGDCRYVIKELYDLVLYYESRLAQAERERDALAYDARGCYSCRHMNVNPNEEPCASCVEDGSGYVWRGLCQENTQEE